MTIHYTFNPIGSTSPKDLIDNAQNIDLMILGPALLYPDRRGVNRLSWAGIEASFAAAQAQRTADFNAAQAQRATDFTAAQANRNAKFNTFMDASGYEPPIAYASGILLDRTTKTVTYLGNEYRAKGSFIPMTTSNWATDEPKLKLIGDDSLRQQLADPITGADNLWWSGRTQSAHNAENVSLASLGILPGGSYTVAQVAAAINNSTAPSIQIPDGVYNLVASGVPTLTLTRGVRLWGGLGAVVTIPRGLTFLNCSGGSAKGFTLNTTDAIYHFAVWARGSGGDHSFSKLRINSAYGIMGTGDASDAANPVRCEFLRNVGTGILGSLNRVSGSNPTIACNHVYHRNEIDIVASPAGVVINKVGIETWTGGTQVTRNRITSIAKVGGFGGITFGLYPDQTADGNWVEGFSAGVEWGNTGGLLHILNNKLIGCGTGLYDGTNGEELAPNVTGNTIVQGPWGVTPVRAVNIKSQHVDLSGCVAIYTEDGNFNDEITITGTSPAGLMAIYADTNHKSITATSMRIYNYEIGLRAAATSGVNKLVGVGMYGVKYPISDSGGNPVNILTGCDIQDFLTFRINKTLEITSSSLSRPAGGVFSAAIGKVPAQFLDTGSPNTQFTYHSNILNGVSADPFTTNANMPDGGGSGYLRPKLAVLGGGVHRVKNVADYATAAAEVTAVLGDVPYDVPIQTWSTNLAFIRRRKARTTLVSGADTIEQYV